MSKREFKARDVVFFTYKGILRTGVVEAVKKHATAGTPYAEVKGKTPEGNFVSNIHPAFLFETEAEARASDPCKQCSSTLDRVVMEKTEYARIAAGSPPEWVNAQRRAVIADFETFKATQVEAVCRAVPGISSDSALLQFAQGMRLFDVLAKAHRHVMCSDYSQALLETMTPAPTPTKIYSLHVRDRWGGDNTTLHRSAEERDLSLCEWLEGNGSLDKNEVRRVMKAIAAGKLDRANELMCEYADSSGHEWTREEHELQKRPAVEIAVTEEGETESEQTSTDLSV